VCAEALELFVSLYGAQAGNLALTVMATGGVFVAGGIAPKIRAMFERPAFLRAFTNKGRLTPLMKSIPVSLVLYDRVAMAGAAVSALRDVQSPAQARRAPARR
jgi:glucokinase